MPTPRFDLVDRDLRSGGLDGSAPASTSTLARLARFLGWASTGDAACSRLDSRAGALRFLVADVRL
jgi:hypothetical protein